MNKNNSIEDILLEVPIGWQNWTREIIANITGNFPHVRIDQVKEKFGLLRIYTSGEKPGDAVILLDIIAIAESKSATLCCACGSFSENPLLTAKNHFPEPFLCEHCMHRLEHGTII